MKKREYKRIALILSTAMIVTLFGGCDKTLGNKADEYKEEIITQALTDTVKSNTASSADNIKEETVYVFTDACGAKKNVLVNEKLNNSKAQNTIGDVTTLNDIVNLSGDEDYTEGNDGKINWNAGGNTITYQGTTTKELPIEIKATYYLEDNEISPENIAGKSGNVRIRFDYTNKEARTVSCNGKDKEMFVPFTVVTGMLLSGDNFSDIEVTNGKTTQIGNDTLVAGVAMPGLNDSIKDSLDDLDITLDLPEFVEIKAYATNFNIDTIITVATSNIAADIDEKEVDTEGLENKMDELQDATDKLEDGSKALQEGTQKLADSVPDLVNGVGDLNSAAVALRDGAGKIKTGVNAYTDGVGKVADGAGKIKDGAGKVSGGIDGLTAKFKTTLIPGIATLSNGATNLSNGLGALMTGISTKLAGAKEQAKTETYSQVTGNAQLTALNGGEAITADNIDAAIATISGQRDAVISALASSETPDEAKGELVTKLNGLNGAIESLKSVKAGVAGADAALTGVQESLAGDTQVAALVQGASDLSDGLTLLKTGVGTFDEAEMQAVIASGNNTVCTALAQLQAGSVTLSDGAGDLSKGLSTLKGKSKALNDGVNSLADGTVKLADGTKKLNDAAGELGDGVGELNSGAITLKDGMIKFNNEGISKLSGLFDSNSDTLIAEVKEVMNLGKEYQSFAGKSDDTEGSVMFIYKMDGISK